MSDDNHHIIQANNSALGLVPSEQGDLVTIDDHLENIQQFIADGQSLESIAVMLAVDVKAFMRACDDYQPLRLAVDRGYILDKQEFEKNLRTAAHSMQSANIVKLYASYKHGIHDQTAQNAGSSGATIIINTGIEAAIPWQTCDTGQ